MHAKYSKKMKFGQTFDFIGCWEFFSQEPKQVDWVQKNKETEEKMKDTKEHPTSIIKRLKNNRKRRIQRLELEGLVGTAQIPLFTWCQ